MKISQKEYTDEKLLDYMKSGINAKGITFAQLVIKFVIKDQVCSEKALNRRINNLVKDNLIERCQNNSPVFYKVKTEEKQK